MICSQGDVKSQTLTAVEALRCATCGRREATSAHRPVKLPTSTTHQPAEKILADIFYVYDMANNTYMLLDVICDSTLLHVAMILDNRTPEHIFRVLRERWLDVFGTRLSQLWTRMAALADT